VALSRRWRSAIATAGRGFGRGARAAAVAAALAACASSWPAGAALVPSPDGVTVYDTVNNVTWLADANYAASNRFGLPVCTGSGQQSCVNPNGSMSYQSAAAWVAAMNAANYLGQSNWQLPTTPTTDPSCPKTGPNGNSFGFGCVANAYGALYSNGLGLRAPNTAVPIPDEAAGPFGNFQPYIYWSSTSAGSQGYLTFSFNTGFHGANTGPNFMYLLPMIPGKLPGTPPAAGSGLQVNPGGQTVYDPVTNVTWLADANVAASDPFGLPPCQNPTTPTLCVAADGAMSWDSASQLLANMNAAAYLGQMNWQMPTIDTSCTNYDCVGAANPMGNLFYAQLGMSKGTSIVPTPDIAVGPFRDVQPYLYWSCLGATIQSACETAGPAPNFEWSFSFGSGFLGTDILGNSLYATAYFVGARTGPMGIWLPVASHAGGLDGSEWRSDAGILNPGAVPANITVTLSASGSTRTTTTQVAAGSQAVLTDVVSQLGYTGSGALEIASDRPVVVTSRTYNQSGSGTFGQDYASYDAATSLGAGQSAWLPQLTENAAYRTNISLTNTGTATATVSVTLLEGAGTVLTTYTATLSPGEWQQAVQPFRKLAGQTAMDGGYAKVAVTAGSGVIASASVIDNTTNDPTTMQMATGAGTAEWLPVASHAGGLNGSEWRSDAGVLNPGAVAANVTLTLHASGSTKTTTTQVPSGSQVILTDVVSRLGYSGSGALEVQADQPVVVSSRTYNQSGSGTFGQDYGSYDATTALAGGQSAWLPQLAENSAYRTNVSLTNIGLEAATVEVTLLDGAGAVLATYTATLDPGEWRQSVQPFRKLAGQTAMDRGYAKVTVTAGSGVIASASVIDNTTNDPTTIPTHR